MELLKQGQQQMIKTLLIILLLTGCAAVEEDYPPKWIIASQYLPREKLKGMQRAGFFEINNSIYSHYCDSHGNMIRMKYNEDKHEWKQIKYETLGCGEKL